MARPTDWSAVGMQLDPVPGDPAEIRQSASSARSIEQAIAEQVRRLNSLKDGEGWESESGTKFRDSAGDLAGAIEKAKGRYTELAAALDQWADGLEGLQREADAALLQAQDAQDAHRAAANQTITADADTPEHQDQVDAQDRALTAAQSDIDAAAAIVRRIGGPFGEEGEYGELAGRVADRIRRGADDGLKDGWFDHVKQAIHDAKGVLEAIKSILNVVALVLVVAAVIVALAIPGVNLIAFAVAGLIVSSVVFGITAAQAAAGDATTSDVIWAAVGVAASAVGLGAAKGAASSLPAMTRSVAQSGARSAANSARASGIAEGPIYSAKYAELQARAAELSGKAWVTVVDNSLTNGAIAPVLIRQLAAGGPVAQQMFPKILVPAVTASVLGAKGLWDGVHDFATDVHDLWTGDYWKNVTSVEVGSL
uniref:WXG100 family type VII secretion target n=1 Tax=Neobacillus citreus TaxID=2833578 RepID=A0A942SWK7_9BACI